MRDALRLSAWLRREIFYRIFPGWFLAFWFGLWITIFGGLLVLATLAGTRPIQWIFVLIGLAVIALGAALLRHARALKAGRG